VADRALSAAAVEARVRASAGTHLRTLRVTNRWEGPQLPPGTVSLTLSLVFQDPERTLTGEEVQAAVDRVVASLRAAGADIRGE
jgi:phenylalanyl-tRNA synthetase beta chain